ncbi:ABC transporter permease subunit [Fusibacter ferrireducens]|uniref:ABC transporter permease subunit n=1 Tax=Fusibacter ferrireducens TaxID=2785058 RepID=A0ABR9ZUF3_9FIRM|nr:ABC transporter permease subunit [Fusibacter ferrireducens]MBF4693510.1 ABC transporter permease subunit [Fusibacter ferrireducens]
MLFNSPSPFISTFSESHFNEIADKSYNGRAVGSDGHERFEEMLVSHFKALQIAPLEDDYKHDFAMNQIRFDPKSVFSIDDQIAFEINKDFMTLYSPITGPIDYQGDIIFLERNYFNIDPTVLEGKIVVSTFNRLTSEVLNYAYDHKIKGLLILEDSYNRTDIKLDPYYGKHQMDSLYIGRISTNAYVQLRQIAKNHLFEGYHYDENHPNDPISGIIPNAKLSIKDQYPVGNGQNIIGKVEGQSDQYVCFYTAYDGIGAYGEQIYNSALVHLSGVEVLMNLMSYCSDLSEKPQKTIYFAFTDAGALGNQGAEALMAQLPSGGEMINLGIFGTSADGGLFVSSRAPDNSSFGGDSNTNSAVLLLRLYQYFEALGIPVTETQLDAHDSTLQTLSHHVPTIKISQAPNTDAYVGQEIPVDMTSLKAGTDQIAKMVSKAYYKDTDYTFIPFAIRVAALITYAIIVIMLLIRAVFKMNPEYKWFGYELYLSTPYMLLTKMLKALIPTVLMLIIMLFILLIPNYITKTDYNGGYTNYVFHLHAERVVHYLTQITTHFDTVIPKSFRATLWISFKNSVRLFSLSILISLVLGVCIGIYTSIKPRKITTLLQMILYSIPDVLLCLLGLQIIIWLFKYDALGPFTAEQLRLYIVPTIIMSIVPTIYISKMVQLNCSDLLEQPFVYGALSRGVPFGKVIISHLLPMALASLFSTMTSILRIILVNLLIVEYLFSCVGIGTYLITKRADPTYVLLISICLGLMYFVTNLSFKAIAFMINPLQRRAL